PEADENTLPNVLTRLMKYIGAPSSLREPGYDENDIDELVNGALKQRRQLSIAPREASPDKLVDIFYESLESW
ncbi:MAG: iron-containing alcohol dehydrogenase, partial [Rubrobacter sp.]|nr:iron-containing alcohol dehydrogenase [Rubrobacter sp.]